MLGWIIGGIVVVAGVGGGAYYLHRRKLSANATRYHAAARRVGGEGGLGRFTPAQIDQLERQGKLTHEQAQRAKAAYTSQVG